MVDSITDEERNRVAENVPAGIEDSDEIARRLTFDHIEDSDKRDETERIFADLIADERQDKEESREIQGRRFNFDTGEWG